MLNQLLLPMTDRDRDLLAGARVRAAYKTVAKKLGYKAVAALWDCDETQVGLKIDEVGRHYMKPHEALSLKRADTDGIIRAAEEAALSPVVTADDVVAQLPAVLRRFLAEELAALIERELWLR